MSVFVDTGVFYAAFERSPTRHETARDALERVLRSAAFGKAVTSEYVYDETVTLTLRRTSDTDLAIDVGSRIRAIERGRLLVDRRFSSAPGHCSIRRSILSIGSPTTRSVSPTR